MKTLRAVSVVETAPNLEKEKYLTNKHVNMSYSC